MRLRIKERSKDLLAVPRGEAQAWVVVLLAVLGMAGWITYARFFAPPPEIDLEAERSVLGEWLAQRVDQGTPARVAAELFAFDPNHLPIHQWQRLGLTERQALAIHRFEERGGSFRSKAELARMRVIDPGLFARWMPYIQLPDSAPTRAHRSFPERNYDRDRDSFPRHSASPVAHGAAPRSPVELNGSDTTALIALPGIGPSFARGIVKYREQLGGYVDLDQLAEVFVLKDKPDAVARLKELLVVDTALVRRIRINRCTAEELAAHPYMRWKLARPLIAYRDQHGPFRSKDAIKGCSLITDEVYGRIAPYLIVD